MKLSHLSMQGRTLNEQPHTTLPVNIYAYSLIQNLHKVMSLSCQMLTRKSKSQSTELNAFSKYCLIQLQLLVEQRQESKRGW